jgi:GDP-L-fucose synthase
MGMSMEKEAKLYIAGHKGLVGSALLRKLTALGYSNLLYRTKAELDLVNQQAVQDFFQQEQPEYVIVAAAKVGGIYANNTKPAEFIYDNLMIATNVIQQSFRTGVRKLLFLGSSCIYPKLAPQPMQEEYLLTGALEPTNDAYAVAKIAGIKMCQAYQKQYGANFITVMPTNLYGPNDNFDLQTAHVLPALLRKFHEAKLNKSPTVEVWGTGNVRREFLHVDDLADACIFLMNNYEDSEIVNIGTGEDITIKELAGLIKSITGYWGDIIWNNTMPDGTPRKLLDVTKLHQLGWKARINLNDGISQVYQWYINSITEDCQC